MNLNSHFSAVIRLVRGLLIALVCAVLLFTNSYPALAIGSAPSQPSEGEAQLGDILEEAQDSIRPENALDSDKVIDRANSGLNEVQEDAGEDQYNEPGNSRGATSAAEQVQRALGRVADKVKGRD